MSCVEEQPFHDAFTFVKKYCAWVIHLECYDGTEQETFESNGIHKLWGLGQNHFGEYDIAIYFHSKGVPHA
jgi:hypothetical protein